MSAAAPPQSLPGAPGSHHEADISRRLLQEGIEHRRLLTFRWQSVFAIFHHADDLYPRTVLEFVGAADGCPDRPEHRSREIAIDDRDDRRIFPVVQRRTSSRQQGGARCADIWDSKHQAPANPSADSCSGGQSD